ncbi:uncharacterized protein [Parasteatoda tepidariorum]|uniref:uncharacterized protein n=1 Tax=Parasteatoda tepidariorum TaxID=114398 RepID=UPI001C71A4C2|nr:uncharacterized protein LOC107454364 [Parasteatoda tepidariorum]
MQHIFCVLFILITTWTHISHGQSSLIINEDRPSLIDTVLQVVWEPSSLIRFWTALDQLYNIGLSWRTAAKTLVTLPFRDGRSMSHVRIQQPRRARGMINSQNRQINLNHLERFNKIYAQSSSPSFHLAAPSTVYESLVLPPQFVFPPQKPIPDPKLAGMPQFLMYNNDLRPFSGFYGDKMQFQGAVSKHPEWLVKEIAKGNGGREQKPTNFGADGLMKVQIPEWLVKNIERGNGGIGVKPHNFEAGSSMNVPLGGASIPSGDPEIRLKMFLKLMKDLGDIHSNKVIFDEDIKEGIR